LVANSWFGIALIHRLQFRALSEDGAIEALATQCNAGPEAKPQLRFLLDLCEAVGIIERANGQLTLGTFGGADEPKVSPAVKPPGEVESLSEVPPPQPQSTGFRSTVSASSTSSPKDGSINLDIGIQVNLAEMRDWTPDRITAFFGGIAQILAAKNKDG
jgi:hypothetical protein